MSNKYSDAYFQWVAQKQRFHTKGFPTSMTKQLFGTDVFDFSANENYKVIAEKSLVTGVNNALNTLKTNTSASRDAGDAQAIQSYATELNKFIQSVNKFNPNGSLGAQLNKLAKVIKDLNSIAAQGGNLTQFHGGKYSNIGQMVDATFRKFGILAALNSEAMLTELFKEVFNSQNQTQQLSDALLTDLNRHNTLRDEIKIKSKSGEGNIGSIRMGTPVTDISLQLKSKQSGNQFAEATFKMTPRFNISMKQYINNDGAHKVASINWRRMLLAITQLTNDTDLYWALYRILAAYVRPEELKQAVIYELGMDAAFGGKLGGSTKKDVIANGDQITDFWIGNKLISAETVYRNLRKNPELMTVNIPYPTNSNIRDIAIALNTFTDKGPQLKSSGIVTFMLQKGAFNSLK